MQQRGTAQIVVPRVGWIGSPTRLVVVASGLLVLHGTMSQAQYSVSSRLLAACLGLIAYVIIGRSPRDALPFAQLAAATMYVFYGAATFWEDQFHTASGPTQLSKNSVELAQLAAILALSAMYAGIGLGQRVGTHVQPAIKKLFPAATTPIATWVVAPWAAFSLTVTYILSTRRDIFPDALLHIAALVSSPAIALSVAHVFRQQRPSVWANTFFWALSLAFSLVGALHGVVSAAVRPLVLAAMFRWLDGRGFQWRWVAMAFCVVLILLPARAAYRSAVWFPTGHDSSDITIPERIDTWVISISNHWIGTGVDLRANISETGHRLSDLLSVAHALEMVPEHIPFNHGKSWLPVFYSLVPRLLWPEKPALTTVINSEYAVVFERQTRAMTKTTAIGVPLMVDGYWSFGWLGIVLVSWCMGLLLGAYSRVFALGHWPLFVAGVSALASTMPHTALTSAVLGIPQNIGGCALATWLVALPTLALSRVSVAFPRAEDRDSSPGSPPSSWPHSRG